MKDFLDEINFAAAGTFDLLNEEVKAESIYESQLAQAMSLRTSSKSNSQAARNFENAYTDSDDPDDRMMATGQHVSSHFEASKANALVKSAPEIRAQLETKKFSIASLSGSLLQYAHGGLVIVHGLEPARELKQGKKIGTQRLSQVIWHCRNQAMHWPEGITNKTTKACIETLISDKILPAGEFELRSHATEIVKAIGWTDVAKFEKDLESLDHS